MSQSAKSPLNNSDTTFIVMVNDVEIKVSIG